MTKPSIYPQPALSQIHDHGSSDPPKVHEVVQIAFSRLREREAGTMLLITMNVVVVLAAMAGAFLTVAHGDNAEHQSASRRIQALYIAEAAVNFALVDLSTGGTGNIGSEESPLPFNYGEHYSACRSLDGVHTLYCVGTFRGVSIAIEAVVPERGEPGYYRGASGSIDMTQVLDSAMVDSYDATAGSYASQASGATDANGDPVAGVSGDIMSNGPVGVGPNATIFGDAVTDTVLAPVLTSVTGTTRPPTAAIDFPPIVLPDMSDVEEVNFCRHADDVIMPGRHLLKDLHVHDSATVKIVGPATIVVEKLEVKDTGTLLIDASGGPVFIYPTQKFIVETSGRIETMSTMPKDLMISSDIDNTMGAMGDLTGDPGKPVQVRDNGSMTGVLYAPNATILIAENGQLFGAVFGKRVNVTGDGALHFDESLMHTDGIPVGGDAVAAPWPTSSGGSEGIANLTIQSWRVVSLGGPKSPEIWEGDGPKIDLGGSPLGDPQDDPIALELPLPLPAPGNGDK